MRSLRLNPCERLHTAHRDVVYRTSPKACVPRCPGLKSLTFLSLDQTKVSDAGMLPYLRSAPASLSQLSLNSTTITEATLAALATSTPHLRFLSIKQTKVGEPRDQPILTHNTDTIWYWYFIFPSMH